MLIQSIIVLTCLAAGCGLLGYGISEIATSLYNRKYHIDQTMKIVDSLVDEPDWAVQEVKL